MPTGGNTTQARVRVGHSGLAPAGPDPNAEFPLGTSQCGSAIVYHPQLGEAAPAHMWNTTTTHLCWCWVQGGLGVPLQTQLTSQLRRALGLPELLLVDGQCSAAGPPWRCQPCHQPGVCVGKGEVPLEDSPPHPPWQAPSAPSTHRGLGSLLPSIPRAPRTGQQWNEAPMGTSCIPTFSIGRCGQGGQGASTHLPTMADPPWQCHRHVPAQPWQAAAPALPAPGLRQPAGLC